LLCKLHSTADVFDIGRMGHGDVREIVRSEPPQIVVFFGGSVDRFAIPAGDEEPMHVQSVVRDLHWDGDGVVDVDTDFFDAFTYRGLTWRLAELDVATDQIPAVRVVTTLRMAMHQEHAVIADECSH